MYFCPCYWSFIAETKVTKRAEIQIRILALNFYMWKRFTGQQYIDLYSLMDYIGKSIYNSEVLLPVINDTNSRLWLYMLISKVVRFPILVGSQVHSNLSQDNSQKASLFFGTYHCLERWYPRNTWWYIYYSIYEVNLSEV